MNSKLSFPLFLIAVVLIAHSAASDSTKPREKRSPKPQIGRLFGFLAKWVAQAVKQSPTAIRLIRRVKAASTAVSKNPETAAGTAAAAAAAGAAVGVGVVVASQPGKKQCAVYIKRDLPELQPVFIKDGTPRSLMMPRDGYLTWGHGETSSIACPPSAGSQNYIRATNTIVATITCDNGLMFEMSARRVNISTVTCARKVTGNYRPKPDPQCAGTNKAIGFNVPFPTGDIFFDLFYSCFDETRGSTLFTHHVLFGNEIDHKCIYGSSRPDFKSAGFPDNFFISTAYTQLSQKARLTDLFNVRMSNPVAQAEAQRYIFDHSYLQKGHLTPDGDELFTTWQWSTYFFINVAGMWESINIGNWKNLETKVRTLANETKENLEIYTGTYETLALCSTNNYCPDFTLVTGGIPVPKWLWKIVKAPSIDAAIALVVSNNPVGAVNPICETGAVNYGWHQNGFDNFSSGKVSYCTVQELQNVVGYIPQAALATNVLAF
uniref:Salivary deoxyribonuclease I n=1 Tax=Ochlerotatus triseriatus TaxID=7162 RepID=C6ZQX7_OCHTR